MQLWPTKRLCHFYSRTGSRPPIRVTQTEQTHPAKQQPEHPSAAQACTMFVKPVRGQGLLENFTCKMSFLLNLLRTGVTVKEDRVEDSSDLLRSVTAKGAKPATDLGWVRSAAEWRRALRAGMNSHGRQGSTTAILPEHGFPPAKRVMRDTLHARALFQAA